MALKPLVTLPASVENFTFVDLGENQVYNGGIYNSKTFFATMPNLVYWNTSFKSKNNAVCVQNGCVWASGVGYSGNLMVSKWDILPSPYTAQVGNVFVDDENIDELYLFLNGVAYPAIKVKNNGQLLIRSSWNLGNNHSRNSVFVRLENGDFVGIMNESYYDRSRLFVRLDSQLGLVHDFKINTNYANACFHYYDGGSIIASANGVSSYGRHILYKYDIASQTTSVLLDINGANLKATFMPSNMIDISDNKYLYFMIQPNATNSFKYRAITFDAASITATSEDWTADYGDQTEADVVFLNANDRRFGGKLWVTTHQDSDGNTIYYLHLLTFARTDYNPAVDNFRLYVWQIDLQNKKLIYKSSIKFNVKILSCAPMSVDFTEVFVVENTNISIIKFNPTLGEWTRIPITLSLNTFVSDILGRNWAIGKDWGLYPLIKSAPSIVDMRLEQEVYKWEGEPIDTNILADAFNYEGDRISVTGTLYLLSDYLEFPDGSKEKQVTISDEGTTAIPIKIVGAGTQPPNWKFVVTSIGG